MAFLHIVDPIESGFTSSANEITDINNKIAARHFRLKMGILFHFIMFYCLVKPTANY